MGLPRRIGATEAARNFASVIGQVRYQAASFEIVKGKEVVARIVPGPPRSEFTLSEQVAQLVAGPRLLEGDHDAFLADMQAAKQTLTAPEITWD